MAKTPEMQEEPAMRSMENGLRDDAGSDEFCLHQESAGRRRQSDHERHGRCSEMPRPRDVKLNAGKRKTDAEHRDSVIKIARTSADCVMRVRCA